MTSDWMRTLYAYNAWANQRLLDTCMALSEEQFTAPNGATDASSSQRLIRPIGQGDNGAAPRAEPSIRDTLVHIMSGQEIWISRCQGIASARLLEPQAFATLAQVRRYWDALEARTRQYLDSIRDEDLAREVHYITTKGLPFSHPLWQILIHQLNHATQHRSEVALWLTRLGYSPGDLDLILYLRARLG